jgi:hypothetical protein
MSPATWRHVGKYDTTMGISDRYCGRLSSLVGAGGGFIAICDERLCLSLLRCLFFSTNRVDFYLFIRPQRGLINRHGMTSDGQRGLPTWQAVMAIPAYLLGGILWR